MFEGIQTNENESYPVDALEFTYFDVLSPKYTILQFKDLPLGALFRDEERFKVKHSTASAVNLFEGVHRHVPPNTFVFSANPPAIIGLPTANKPESTI